MFALRRLKSGRFAVILPAFTSRGTPAASPAATDMAFALVGAAWLAVFAAMALDERSVTVAEGASSPTGAAPTLIADAAREGDFSALSSLLAQSEDLNAPAPDGSTLLHWAVYYGDIDAAGALLAGGADPAQANREGVTPLTLAAINGDAAMIERLLDAGADVNGRLAQGETPLMLAARTGVADAVELLIDRGAEIDATEARRGTTALMWAAANANPDAVAVLLVRGADFSMRSSKTALGRGPYLADTARDRIIDFQRGFGQAGRAIAVNLQGEGEDLDQSTLVDASIAQAARARAEENAEEEREEVTLRGEGGGLTALVFAARAGDLHSARLLVEAGADIDQTTQYGWTPLLTAVQNRYYELAAYLLEQGADPNIANNGGWSPLYIAVDNRNIEKGDYPTRRPDMDHMALIQLLLDHGADPNLRMSTSTETRTIFTHQWLHEEGATPFLRAAQSGDVAVMQLLLERGADPDIATEAGVTPLMVASGIGWVEGVTYEWSPAQTLEAIELLLDLGADINAQDAVDGRTALMGAAHKGRSDVVELLVSRGADLSLRDIGSRDSIHVLAGTTWQAVDYADGLVRVGVQSATAHPETASLLRRLMEERGLPVPAEGRTLQSICVTELCAG